MTPEAAERNPDDVPHSVRKGGVLAPPFPDSTEESGPVPAAADPGAQLEGRKPSVPSRATLPLLVEIGCEEIPARFLADAQQQFAEHLMAALREARLLRDGVLAAAKVHSYSTPRRLVAHVPAVLSSQPDAVEEITGPPAKIAFDAEGNPTRAAESFAAKAGVQLQDLLQVETPKGLYVAARRTVQGLRAADVLASILPSVITDLTFPKSMIWEDSGVRFVRPIRWIVALLGEDEAAQVIPFEVAGVKSGNVTYRHRLAKKPEVAVTGFKDYASKLRRGDVEIDPAKRRARIRKELQVSLDGFTGNISQGESGAKVRVIQDSGLEDWIVCSTECPRTLTGEFDGRFLELPREILITVMRDHQKYFAVEDAHSTMGAMTISGSELSIELDRKLAPAFVTVLNVPGDPSGIIRRGHERVLAARLEDAKFFWHADQKIPLQDRVPMLEQVTYQAKLGTYGDKVRRMLVIAKEICSRLQVTGQLTPEDAAHALHAIELAKCDLTSQMVQEFTELQGVVGGLYAAAQGEPPQVWQAIYDQYQPESTEDDCPRSPVGAILSLADKLDALASGFSAGLEPTGSSDPFGLRRAGNGIIKIAVEVADVAGLDVLALADNAVRMRPGLQAVHDISKGVGTFLRERTEYYLGAVRGLRYDTVRAVVSSSAGWSPPADVLRRGNALDQVRDTEDFKALSIAAKRTRNILSKSASQVDLTGSAQVDENLFRAPEERDLLVAYQSAREALDRFQAGGDYVAAFLELAKLRGPVDHFFDKVMVMDQNLALRTNRLALLKGLNALAFSRLADLSEIESVTPAESGDKGESSKLRAAAQRRKALE
ncbi:MAG TPA: glycine--tRNA ligase subunit beta [Terriglobia bacterium]|nr:glycine--tRNA ligase subunit beta [Terriglobia bacterium]